VVSIIFFALAVRSLITSGFSAGAMVTVLVMTAVFMGVCLFFPPETKGSTSET
jgi:hypothetical protein